MFPNTINSVQKAANNFQSLHSYFICDWAWENRSYVHILYFEKYEFEILNVLFFSCGTVQSRQMYYLILLL